MWVNNTASICRIFAPVSCIRSSGAVSTNRFPKSEALRGIARHVPADRLLVETDAPYLAPVPMRGSKNEPANVVHTAAKLAEVRRIGLAEIAELTTANFKRLFVKSQ